MTQHSQSGFTLIETLVASMILIIGLMAAFQAATSALNLSVTIQNSLVASNLAQEGVEIVHAIRDGNWFSGNAFDTGLRGCPYPSNCRGEWDQLTVGNPAGSPPLQLDPSTGLYQYNTGPATPFTRSISTDSIKVSGTTVAILVRVVVSWTERGVAKSLMVEDYVYDWN